MALILCHSIRPGTIPARSTSPAKARTSKHQWHFPLPLYGQELSQQDQHLLPRLEPLNISGTFLCHSIRPGTIPARSTSPAKARTSKHQWHFPLPLYGQELSQQDQHLLPKLEPLNISGTFLCHSTARNYPSKINISCQSSNLVHTSLIACSMCGIQYGRQTKDSIIGRFQGHFNDISSDRDTSTPAPPVTLINSLISRSQSLISSKRTRAQSLLANRETQRKNTTPITHGGPSRSQLNGFFPG